MNKILEIFEKHEKLLKEVGASMDKKLLIKKLKLTKEGVKMLDAWVAMKNEFAEHKGFVNGRNSKSEEFRTALQIEYDYDEYKLAISYEKE